MSAPLDEKGLEAAHNVIWPATEWNDGEHACRETVRAAIRAYLAASPSPSMEMEVDDFVRKLRDFEQAYSTEFFTPLTEAEKARVGGELRSRIAADMGRHMAKFLVQAADRIEAAEAQVLRLTEENKALRRVLGNAEKALSATERWIEAEFPNSEIELNGALSNVHAEVSNTAYDARSALKENAL